jgi:hypothetical protein
MTIDIEKLEALAKAATPGPWKSVEGGLVVCSFHAKHGYNVHDMRRPHVMTPDVSFSMGDVHRNDSAFIAAAREAVPALIARVREMEAALMPFAGEAETLWEIEDEQRLFYPGAMNVSTGKEAISDFTVGDLRSASRALTGEK